MSGKRIEAGDAYVGLGIRSKIKAGLDQAKRRLQSFGTFARNTGAGIAGAGVAIGSGFLAAAKVFASTGDELDKMSARVGISVDELARLKFGAERSGASIQDIEKSARQMGRVLLDASEGVSTAEKTLDALGITLQDVEGLTPDEQFKIFADSLSKIENTGRRSALSLRLFGRAGSALLPLMNQGSAGIENLGDEAERLGLVLSKDQTDAAAALTDSWGDLTSVFKGMVTQIGAAVSGPLTRLFNLIASGGSQVVKFVQSNQSLVIAAGAVAAGLTIAGTALAGLGTAALIIPPALGAIATAGGVVATVFGALASPIALAGAAVAAGVVYFAQYTEAGRAVVEYFSSGFATLKGIVTDVVGGISSALSGGDIGLAAKIGFTGVKLAVAEVMQETERIFGVSFEKMFQTLAKLAKNIGRVLVEIDKVRLKGADFLANAGVAVGEYAGLLDKGTSDVLKQDQSRRVNGFEKLVESFDANQFGSEIADGFDLEALKAEMAALKDDAETVQRVAAEAQEAAQESAKAAEQIADSTDLPAGLPDFSTPIAKIQESFKSISSLSAASLNQRRPNARPLEEKVLKSNENQETLLRQVRDKMEGTGLAFE